MSSDLIGANKKGTNVSAAGDLFSIINLYFEGGWRISPFFKGDDGQLRGVKKWPQRAAKNHEELTALCKEVRGKFFFGVVPAEGQYVIDIDMKGGKNGMESWNNHLKEVYPDSNAPEPMCIVKSKSGGYHLYYHHTKKIKLPSPTAIFGKASGVDVRGYSGMVLMPTKVCEINEWEAGVYAMVRGNPCSAPSIMPFSTAVPKAAIKTASDVEMDMIHSALNNKAYPPSRRSEALPEFTVPESGRDQTLYFAARMCRRVGLNEADALTFLEALAIRCELADNETTDQWIAVAKDKVKRNYEGDPKITTVHDFYGELDYAGVVRCAADSGSVYYSRYGSKLLEIPARRSFTLDGLRDLLRGKVISVTPEGKSLYAHIALNNWDSAVTVDSYGMLPKSDVPFFENSAGHRCVNTYIPSMEGFDVDEVMFKEAYDEIVPLFIELVNHVAGTPEDGAYLMQKFAWLIQKPYLKPVTANIIYSETRGVGKDSLMDLIGQLFHHDYYIKLQEKDFDARFAIFHEKLIAVFSEIQLAHGAYSRKDLMTLVGRLKQLITNRQITIEEKFKPSRIVDSFTTFFLLSNYELAAIMEPGERRLDVFHSREEKIDQRKFGPILDIANKQNRNDTIRFSREQIRHWDHCLFAIRNYLSELELKYDFSKQEARSNSAKETLAEMYAGDTANWLRRNLPPVWTKELLQWLATMCPYKLDHRFAFENLKEAFGNKVTTVRRAEGSPYRLKNCPLLTAKDDGMGRKTYVLAWNDVNARSQLYTFESSDVKRIYPDDHSEAFIRAQFKHWIKEQNALFASASAVHSSLPGSNQNSDLVS